MEDLISREAAIKAIHERAGVDGFIDLPQEYVTDAIRALPSAQPEIIRCNSCKHWTQTIGEMRGFGIGRCDFHDAEYVTCNGFCYWAERRELNGRSYKQTGGSR